MALSNRLTITPVSGGSSIGIHGCSGQIQLVSTVGERFRRPGAGQAGYQKLGSDCVESTLDIWHAFSTSAEMYAVTISLSKLKYSSTVKINFKEYVDLQCMITDFRVTKSVACRGSIITGSTAAAYRLEATITLEHTP